MTINLNLQRVHLMGIGGAGMSALAKLLQAHGLEVSGCDLKEPHYDLGTIPCLMGHSPQHIDTLKPDALILSSAVHRDNPEVLSAQAEGIPILSRAQALSSLFNQSFGIGIAGAHGKTTTTSMTGLLFLKAGLAPTIYVGANVPDIGSNAVSGTGPHFIAELDESDGTFELFTPNIAIITNADWDHVDHYPTRQAVIDAFTRYADGRKEGGILVACADDEGASQVLARTHGKVVTYGQGASCGWRALDITNIPGGGVSCVVEHEGHVLGKLELSVSGVHNIMNALAAIASAHLCGISFEQSAAILKDFHGSERRMQVKGTTGDDVLVMDDYAHHPGEIRATLKAVRGIYPERRVVVVFQPHRYSRTAKFAPDIAEALALADEAYVLPVYAAGEAELPNGNADEIVRHSGGKIGLVAFDDAPETLKGALRHGDILLTMGAGNVYELGEKIMNANQSL